MVRNTHNQSVAIKGTSDTSISTYTYISAGDDAVSYSHDYKVSCLNNNGNNLSPAKTGSGAKLLLNLLLLP